MCRLLLLLSRVGYFDLSSPCRTVTTPPPGQRRPEITKTQNLLRHGDRNGGIFAHAAPIVQGGVSAQAYGISPSSDGARRSGTTPKCAARLERFSNRGRGPSGKFRV